MSEVIEGLTRPQKAIHPKFFYDERGSDLFEQISLLPEYYLTRAETEILEERARVISSLLGESGTLIELGSGGSRKTRLILKRLGRRCTYVPIEISGEILDREAGRLAKEFPSLRIHPVCADFLKIEKVACGEPRLVFFPGSTIGNFEPSDALALLRRMGRLLGGRGHLVIGVDLVKDRRTLEAAYNDSSGVTAAFNRNVLVRLNREYGADFDPGEFDHRAFFDSRLSRVEMHLISLREQAVHLGDRVICFRRGESIHTENSYKYESGVFAEFLRQAGFTRIECWTGARGLFAVYHAVQSGEGS